MFMCSWCFSCISHTCFLFCLHLILSILINVPYFFTLYTSNEGINFFFFHFSTLCFYFYSDIVIQFSDGNSLLLFSYVFQGVKFMYDCVTGQQLVNNTGCIMADEMVGGTVDSSMLFTLQLSMVGGKQWHVPCKTPASANYLSWQSIFIQLIRLPHS